MKRDKAARAAERKAALLKQLKNLLIPVVILLIIVVAVYTIMTTKEQEEPAEIVKINGYEGGEKNFVLENDKILFSLDSKTTQFSVTMKDTGKVWYSNPQDAGTDTKALGAEKNKLLSTLLLTYSTINGVDTLYNNYTYSMEKGIYEIEQGDDYIKVYYSIGDVEREYVIPTVVTADRMEAMMEGMERNDRLMILDYYKKYDINNLGKKDDKSALLESYPILETETAYILRSSVGEVVKTEFEKLFARNGYTYEDFLADKELDRTVKVSDKPVFNVNVVYRLDGDDLVVEVPLQEIEYKKDYPLYTVSILPYFGAGGIQDKGSLFVPEGGGALIDFNNGKTDQSHYYAGVYGWDKAQDRSAVVHETKTCFNVFGISDEKEDSSFLCILEKGAPYSSITADVSGKSNSYNYVNATYNIVHREQYDVADKYTGSMFVYEQDMVSESLVQRYRFVDSADYTDMAEAYREYLFGRYGEYFVMNTVPEAPVVVEIVGAADKVRQVLGMPISRPLVLTTFREAEEIVRGLQGEGFHNMSVKLSGWANGGVRQSVLNKVKPVSGLGSKKDLKELAEYAVENGIGLYLDGITNYAYDSGLGEGFLAYRDAARFVSKEQVKLNEYSTVTFGKAEDQDSYYLLRAGLVETMARNLSSAASGYGAGVSFSDIGNELSSDFNLKNRVSRQAALERQGDLVRELRDSGASVMANAGNDYVMPYVSVITNMDLDGTEYTIIDRFVPFYQMAVHGYVDYTGGSLNIAQDWEEELLTSAEYGAGLSFTVMKETAFALQDTKYTRYFGADYSAWHDRMTEIYRRYNEELGATFSQRMVGHSKLTDTLSCTEYEDGTKVYVNYGYEDVVADDGTAVRARDYTAVR